MTRSRTGLLNGDAPTRALGDLAAEPFGHFALDGIYNTCPFARHIADADKLGKAEAELQSVQRHLSEMEALAAAK